jgi:imidazole glycerol-phosphate synthase subunit HisH
MRELKAVDGIRMIGRRVAGGRPVLGICVGLQVLFEAGVEHGTEAEGMGEWPGKVELLPADVVPHMGWNTVAVPVGSKLFAGVEDERFYFVHSYGVQNWDFDVIQPRMAAPLVTWSDHGAPFIAAVENGPLCATQFHPEKSGDAGARLLRNWVGSLRPATPNSAPNSAGSNPATLEPATPDPSTPEQTAKMWSLVLMGLAGLLVGGAISFKQQKSPRWVQIVFYLLAGMSLLAAYLLTLPAS